MKPQSEVLDQLLAINHERYAMLVHGSLHSHLAHILGSVYLLGGSSEHMRAVFDTVSTDLEGWKPPRVAVKSDEDLYAHLGDPSYQRAFLEYFDDRLERDFGGNWKALSLHYLVNGDKPLLSGTVGGFGHPLIHFTDAFELQSQHLAVEALAMTAVDYNPLHLMVDALVKPSSSGTLSALQVLNRVRADTRFDRLFEKPGVSNTMIVLKSPDARSAIVDHARSFNLSADNLELAESKAQELTRVATLLLAATYEPENGKGHAFDFYLTHQITFCWALHVLIPSLPANARLMLLHEVWLLMLLTYVTEMRPAIVPERLSKGNMTSIDVSNEWKRLTNVALNSTKSQGMDPHYVKVIRNLREFANIWPDDEPLYLNACIAFERDFVGWAALN